jgi:hypothetical protein
MIQNYHSATDNSRKPRRAGRRLQKVDDDSVAGFRGAVVFNGNNWMEQVSTVEKGG